MKKSLFFTKKSLSIFITKFRLHTVLVKIFNGGRVKVCVYIYVCTTNNCCVLELEVVVWPKKIFQQMCWDMLNTHSFYCSDLNVIPRSFIIYFLTFTWSFFTVFLSSNYKKWSYFKRLCMYAKSALFNNRKEKSQTQLFIMSRWSKTLYYLFS